MHQRCNLVLRTFPTVLNQIALFLHANRYSVNLWFLQEQKITSPMSMTWRACTTGNLLPYGHLECSYLQWCVDAFHSPTTCFRYLWAYGLSLTCQPVRWHTSQQKDQIVILNHIKHKNKAIQLDQSTLTAYYKVGVQLKVNPILISLSHCFAQNAVF